MIGVGTYPTFLERHSPVIRVMKQVKGSGFSRGEEGAQQNHEIQVLRLCGHLDGGQFR